MDRLYARLVLLVLVLAFFRMPAVAQNRVTGRVLRAESGDVVRVQMEGWQVSVRLHGIECPTSPPELAARAHRYTARRVEGVRVALEVRGTGPKQTLYGEVYPDGPSHESLNVELVRVGLATWAREYAPRRTELGEIEAQAHATGRGLWSDPTGANVPLPKRASGIAPASSGSPRVSGTGDRRKTAGSPTPSASPLVQPPAAATARPITPPPVPNPEPRTPKPDFRIPVFLFLTALVFGLLQWLSGWNARAVPAQLGVSVLAAGGGLMVAWLPGIVAGGRFPAGAPGLLTLLPGGLVALAVVGLWAAVLLARKEQVLRATPRTPVDRLRPGFVRVAGAVSAPNGVVESAMGRIPGVYIREVSWKCEATATRPIKPHTPRRSVPHEWVSVSDETHAVPFLLTDDTGAVTVDPGPPTKWGDGGFRPLRVARFYNDVPVEDFFDNPYIGDTRAEVYFIPVTANVIVWGRFHLAENSADTVAGYIRPDPQEKTLLVVEENPARVYTARPLWGLALTLAAVLCMAGAAFLLLNPPALDANGFSVPTDSWANHTGIAGIAFALGLYLLASLLMAGWTALRQRQAVAGATRDLSTAFDGLRSRLEAVMPVVIAHLPEAQAPTQAVRNALARAQTLDEERQAARHITDLLRVLDVADQLGIRSRSGGNETLADLRIELRAREEYIAEAGERYDAAVSALANSRRTFPTALLAAALEGRDYDRPSPASG